MNKIRFNVVLGRNGHKDRCGNYSVTIEARQDDKRAYFPTNVHVAREQFSGGLVVNHPLADKYNDYLYKLRNDIEAVELDMIVRGKRCTLQMLKSAYTERTSPSMPFSNFAKQMMQDSGRCKHTKDTYMTTCNAIETFRKGVTLADIDYDFVSRFQKWSKEKGLSHNTIVCRLRNVRAIINEAVRRRLMSADDNPFNVFRIPSMTSRKGFLDYKDLRRLERLHLEGHEAHIRDVFLFACYTGLRFSDLKTLRQEHFKDGWITKKMVKTGDVVQIPYKTLFRGKAADIIKGYDSIESFSDIGQNGEANKTLHIVAGKAKIERKCTFHLARHTCGSLLLREGVPVTTVQMILGHKKLETTKGYAEVDDITINKDIRKAFKK